ncbi:bifunctional glutamate--cysteine ligase GshA/glutathione synthetase GshB, partial [Turicibacter sanguinis]|nr:bifunctional glutamate--cysteine ligase GshA/glutathione synthetase GshB [Turicibacter sanguinis]
MLMQLKSLLNSRELMEGKFGIERECLRVNPDGSLALSPHPTAFGEKQFNPYITTDFSESQIEMITPTFKTLEEAHQFLSTLYDIVSVEVGDELLWPQSMPCFIKPNQEIPIAMFSDSEEGQKLMTYRESLLKKYGGKRQLISGLHYNFSFSESLLVKLFGAQHDYSDFRLFKDAIYLKVVRNYIRYRWLLIYLLGASPIVDESYCSECSVSSNEVAPKSFSRSGAISFRNSLCGYQNKKPIYVDYTSAKTYVNSLKAYIEAGEISSFKEFYSPIRLKAIRPNQLLESLIEDGIEYLEIRSIDLNPFAKEGITLNDLHFIQLFVLFLLDEEESNDPNWQEEANENERRVAVSGLD